MEVHSSTKHQAFLLHLCSIHLDINTSFKSAFADSQQLFRLLFVLVLFLE